jgi:hypothetical protein
MAMMSGVKEYELCIATTNGKLHLKRAGCQELALCGTPISSFTSLNRIAIEFDFGAGCCRRCSDKYRRVSGGKRIRTSLFP